MGVFGKDEDTHFEIRDDHPRCVPDMGNQKTGSLNVKKNSYMFTNKEHTQKGIMSTILGVISLATLAYAIFMSYRRVGNIPRQYGAAAMLVMIFAFVGVGLGVVSKTERDKFYLFTYLGIFLNVLALAVISVILYAGAYA